MYRIVASLGFVGWMALSAGLWSLADQLNSPLPSAEIIEAVNQRFPDASIRQSRLKRGTGIYELIVRRPLAAGRFEDMKLRVTLAGWIQRIERPLSKRELPQAVLRNIERKYPNGRVQEVKEIALQGPRVYYEVRLATPEPKCLRIESSPRGAIVCVTPDA